MCSTSNHRRGYIFAAILGDGSVVTWGDSRSGGDSSAVQGQLRNVQHIQASYSAFAAVLENGSVVTWGGSTFGGDSKAVEDELRPDQSPTPEGAKRQRLRKNPEPETLLPKT